MVRNSTMEPTFYEEQVGSMYGPAASRIAGPALGSAKRANLNLSLDLNGRQGGGQCVKRPRLGPLPGSGLNGIAPILASPDLLKLGSPEFEKLLIAQQDGLITTMPTPTSQIYFEKAVTEEQEQYARGFVDALNELHHSDSSQEPGSVHGATYTTLEPAGGALGQALGLVQVKDEPQTVPSVSSSPPMSPIDMESQERIKLERKRQRNRVAASKCRRRKLERISRLEDKVKLLKGENSDLSQVVNRLREHVSRLKEQVIDHMHSGCQIAPVPGIF
ncbi:PREDICTED: transcription factor AP-1 [Ceratosolen solmsi marchali]|uniref:Transcription factor AP-1 n=1 Tax=Ceratosolen solmsi marchali TaxID=326594 RepID=A0AAJ7E2B4_9HYME|nr:PREDICTED: transcription factor AP-1 [Ceratosolen solmsi marchali]